MPGRAVRLGVCLLILLPMVRPPAATAAGFTLVASRISWDTIFTGARSEAMGQADLAAGLGTTAILDNPAPLPSGRTVLAGYGHLEYLPGLDFHTYGFAVERGAFRLGAQRVDLRSDDMPIRTAYNPEGTGETFRIDDRLVVLAGGADVAQLLAPHSHWNWTVGFAHRHYRFSGGDGASHADGVDFGSSARRTGTFAGGRWQVAAAGVIGNVGQTDLVPHVGRFGVALTLALDGRNGRDVVGLTVARTWVDDMDDAEYFDARRCGVELTLLEALSVRVGRDDRIFGGSSQYGLGVAVPRRWLDGWSIVVDWCSLGVGDNLLDLDELQGLSVTVTADL